MMATSDKSSYGGNWLGSSLTRTDAVTDMGGIYGYGAVISVRASAGIGLVLGLCRTNQHGTHFTYGVAFALPDKQ